MPSLPFTLAVALSGYVFGGHIIQGGNAWIRQVTPPPEIRTSAGASPRSAVVPPYIRESDGAAIRSAVVPAFVRRP